MNASGAVKKGKAGERELANLLREWFGEAYTIRRNLMQSMVGGYDLEGLPNLAIEVKRVERLAIPKWWRQARTQADNVYAPSGSCYVTRPLLAYRQNRKRWTFVVRVNDYLRWGSGSGVYELMRLGRDKTPAIFMDEEAAKCWLGNFLDDEENKYAT